MQRRKRGEKKKRVTRCKRSIVTGRHIYGGKREDKQKVKAEM